MTAAKELAHLTFRVATELGCTDLEAVRLARAVHDDVDEALRDGIPAEEIRAYVMGRVIGTLSAHLNW